MNKADFSNLKRPRYPMPDFVRRALEEAESRRASQKAFEKKLAEHEELDGKHGPDPVRYGDWENKGIISDF